MLSVLQDIDYCAMIIIDVKYGNVLKVFRNCFLMSDILVPVYRKTYGKHWT